MTEFSPIMLSTFLFLYLLLCSADPVIDVDVSSSQTSFQFVAGRDGQGVQYRCVVNGSPVGLTWWFNGTDKGNPLNAYQFYGEYRALTDYTVECHSSSGRVGNMTLTLKDAVKFNLTYSGTVRTFSRDDGKEQKVFIPLNTQNIVFTCEISYGILFTPIGIRSGTNPSITLTELTESRGGGVYQCQRFISTAFLVLDLVVRIGEPPTSISTPTIPVTTPMTTTTTTTTSTTAAVTTSTLIPTSTTTLMTTNTPSTSSTATNSIHVSTLMTTATTASIETTESTSTTTTTATHSTKSTPTLATETTVTPTTTTTTTTSISSATSIQTTISRTNLTFTKLDFRSTSHPTTVTNSTEANSNSTTLPSTLPTHIIIMIVAVLSISICCTLSVVVISVLCVMIYHKRTMPHSHTKLVPDSSHLEYATAPQTGIYYELDSYQQNPRENGGYYEIVDGGNSFTDLRCEIERLTADNNLKLIAEFESIPNTSNRTMDTARLHKNAGKNRYQDFLPYDHTRVVLSGSSDYINASFVPIGQNPNVFIATQGPLVDTVSDLWRMLVDNNVSCVVQLTDPVENGRRRCELYWPECRGSGMEVAGVEIRLVEEVCEGEWFRRELAIGQSGSTITQFHYTGWGDGTIPDDTSGMVDMLQGVRERHNTDTPICVVCTSGVGRTGVFILLYTAMRQLETGESVCLPEILRSLRQHRAYLVQTVEQYRFAYLCLLEMLLGNRGVKVPHSYPESEATVARVEEEFLYLEFLDSVVSSGIISDAIRPENQSMNTHSSLPYDRNRVLLETGNWHNGDYINASHVNIRGVKMQFIATLNPHNHTSAAFLQMLCQTRATTVVALVTVREWEGMVSGVSACCCYWPEEGLETNIDRFSVETVSHERVGRLIKQTLRITDTLVSQNHLLNHYVLMEWEDAGTPTHLLPVVKLAERITSELSGPVIVHCRDVIGKTGVFITLCSAVAMMRQGRSVDVMRLVKSARTQRRHMVCNKEQYSKCYQLISEYRQLTTYQNISSEQLDTN